MKEEERKRLDEILILTHRKKHIYLVSGVVLFLLIVTAVVALLEEGPPATHIAIGASPSNPGSLGTFTLFMKFRENYDRVYIVYDWEKLSREVLGECKYAVLVVISPEIKYNFTELVTIKELLSNCEKYGVMIADETTTSNELLSYLGFGSKVMGQIVRDPETRTPYVKALVELPWSNFTAFIWLDIASRVRGSADADVIAYTLKDTIPVALIEEKGNRRLVLWGDGSIFVNQVIAYEDYSYYELLDETIKYLCWNQKDCIIFLESSKYLAIDPLKLDNVPSDLREALIEEMQTNINIQALVVSRLLHPSTWLPAALRILDNLFYYIMNIYSAKVLTTIATILVVLIVYLKLYEPARKDYIKKPSITREVTTRSSLANYLAKGVKLSEEDFSTMYSILDKLFVSRFGVSLADENFVKILVKCNLDMEKARNYYDRMNKYYEIAHGYRSRPIFLNWNKIILELLRESNSIVTSCFDKPLSTIFSITRFKGSTL